MIEVYAIELQRLADAGCRYVQLDETSLAKLGDPKMREALTARGDPWEELLATYIGGDQCDRRRGRRRSCASACICAVATAWGTGRPKAATMQSPSGVPRHRHRLLLP